MGVSYTLVTFACHRSALKTSPTLQFFALARSSVSEAQGTARETLQRTRVQALIFPVSLALWLGPRFRTASWSRIDFKRGVTVAQIGSDFVSVLLVRKVLPDPSTSANATKHSHINGRIIFYFQPYGRGFILIGAPLPSGLGLHQFDSLRIQFHFATGLRVAWLRR